jgi:hypothetical protein
LGLDVLDQLGLEEVELRLWDSGDGHEDAAVRLLVLVQIHHHLVPGVQRNRSQLIRPKYSMS